MVELSFVPPDRSTVCIGKDLPVNELRVSQTNKCLRLGADTEKITIGFHLRVADLLLNP